MRHPRTSVSSSCKICLGAFDGPILVIWGEDDRVIPAAHANALEGAKTVIISGAGHMAQMEKASRVNELVLAHLGA